MGYYGLHDYEADQAAKTEGVEERKLVTTSEAIRMLAEQSRVREDAPVELPAAGKYILDKLVDEWSVQFAQKNMEYGEYDMTLGPKGEYVELHRKFRKIRRAIWNEANTTDWAEQPREVLLDLIGHCFLMLYLLDHETDWSRSADGI